MTAKKTNTTFQQFLNKDWQPHKLRFQQFLDDEWSPVKRRLDELLQSDMDKSIHGPELGNMHNVESSPELQGSPMMRIKTCLPHN